MERFVKFKKKTAYLYIGIVFAAIALIMIVTSVLSVIRGDRISIPATGFGAAVMWGAAAFACMRFYYKSNRIYMPLFEEKTDSPEDDN